jgi:molybdopterin converting factor small subunit
MTEDNGCATVRVKFYGPLRQFVRAAEQTADAPSGTSIRALIVGLGVPEEHLVYTMALANDRRVPLDTPVADGDKIDVFQPVAGG